VIGGVSALAVAGAVAVGFMGTNPAIADGAKDEVVFSGGCSLLGLSNKSVPDKSTLTITEGDSVSFTNNLGKDATLVIGNTTKNVDEGSSATVALNGSVEAIMKPKCGVDLHNDYEKTTVTAKAAHHDPGGDDNGGGSGGGGGGSTGGGHHSGGGDSGSTGDKQSKPGAPGSGDKPAASGHNGDPNKKDGKKPSDDSSASDDSGAAGTAGDDSGDNKHIDAVDASQSGGGASGMLAVLAGVCLAGVGFAAVRTAVNSRSSAQA
jgi:hypothetical protein